MKVGSSPHTRGAQQESILFVRHTRIIPAYAGSTLANFPVESADWDHPRIRGEHLRSVVPSFGYCGSSPHTRGARVQHQPVKAQPRIIPAYAGSTRIHRNVAELIADHPRIRGEHGTAEIAERLDSGSSPHTRGALDRGDHPSVSARIIPAYAGSTGRSGLDGLDPADHPRIRGEHRRRPTLSCHTQGSSPHTRGARTR